MDSNTHSTRPPARLSGRLAALTAAVDGLDAEDGNGLADPVRAEEVLELRGLLDRLEGHWLKDLAAVDARGAAGAEQGVQVASTAAWLRSRLRMGAGAARSCVRTARALFGGPLTATAAALTDGAISPAHAAVVANGTHDLTHQVTADAEAALLNAARQLDPHRLRTSPAICGWSLILRGPMVTGSGAMPAGDCGWLRPLTAWSRWMGCWRPRPASSCWPPWNPWLALLMPRTAAVGLSVGRMP